jgi:sugar phosphate isomerase/epimerase
MIGLGRKKKLGIALMCADWRLHQGKVDLNRKIARALKVHGVDVLSVPGPDGLLLPARETEWKSAVRQVAVLNKAHAPAALAVVAHQRCAGHAVSDEEHETDAAEAAKALKSALAFAGPVAAFVATYKSDNSWGLKKIAEF